MWPAGVLCREAHNGTVPIVDLQVALQAESQWTSMEAPVVLSTSLAPGQSFGWKKLNVPGSDAFLGVLKLSAVLFVQKKDGIQWQTLAGPEVTPAAVRTFFALDDGLEEIGQRLRKAWAERCPRLAEVAKSLPGLCVLQQDLVETIFGFICSQNNNVSRICLLMDRLRAKFGQALCSIAPGIDAQGDLAVLREFNQHRTLHLFPSVKRLALVQESALRKLGLGYRAAYVQGAAKKLSLNDCQLLTWLEDCKQRCDLANIDVLGEEEPEELRLRRLEIRKELCRLPGVGPKVADCIALFALKQHGAVPVDVHVWRIVTRDYDPALREAKSLTPAVYERVGDAFRRRFGAIFSGWAHSLLFGAEFGELRTRLPVQVLEDMDKHREEEKLLKRKKKTKAAQLCKKPAVKKATKRLDHGA
eukprot:Skav211779  [mRNA]  locus=scaffold305:104721:105968:+ [translate_table: standard]